MKKDICIKCGESKIPVRVPEENLLYFIGPKKVKTVTNEREYLRKCLKSPIASAPLIEQVQPGMKVAILIDDLTRPTPQNRILPVLLNELNQAGVKNKDILVMIALGTHRYMTESEITERVGKEVAKRVEIVNHEWKDKDNFVNLGTTEIGTPVVVNKKVCEVDYIIGVGSIVPHEQAGYSGGAKIVQPGICSWETTGHTHMMAVRENYLGIAGKETNSVRAEIEKVAQKVGLSFIVNVVIDNEKKLVAAVAGDFVQAQREGIKYSREIYERPIPAQSDVVVLSAYPAEIDYWQGLKALSYAIHGVKKGGTTILMAPFPDGISPVHSELEKYGNKSYDEIEKLYKKGELRDKVCAAALFLHALALERTKVICVSEGMSIPQKKKLNFQHADSVNEALRMALARHGRKATVGIIDYGGDVLPTVGKNDKERGSCD